MKNNLCVIAAIGCMFLACALSEPSKPALKIQWQSEAIAYTTNHYVWDEERNKTNTSKNLTFYKTTISTNPAAYIVTYFGDRVGELGLREDGVVVWRERK